MTNNDELAFNIFKMLKANGAEVGNAAVPLISNLLDEHQAQHPHGAIDYQGRVEAALAILEKGQPDAKMHLYHRLDQVLRALCGCAGGAENAEYLMWIAMFADGEEGPDTYYWETGVPG